MLCGSYDGNNSVVSDSFLRKVIDFESFLRLKTKMVCVGTGLRNGTSICGEQNIALH